MSKSKNIQPKRMCIVCRRKSGKGLLQRYVWNPETATVVLDEQQQMQGRGAYCCTDALCVERFLARRQGWKRAFRLN